MVPSKVTLHPRVIPRSHVPSMDAAYLASEYPSFAKVNLFQSTNHIDLNTINSSSLIKSPDARSQRQPVTLTDNSRHKPLRPRSNPRVAGRVENAEADSDIMESNTLQNPVTVNLDEGVKADQHLNKY